MRAFLGVPVPSLDSLRTLLDALRASGAPLKIVDADRFHLTLNFLGDVREAEADALLKLVRAEPLPPGFDIVFEDVGAFPGWKRPSVVWAGVQDPQGGLAKLHVASARAWTSLGHLGENRAFRPHLTLARARANADASAARDALASYRNQRLGEARIDRINLYKSTLTATGPLYEVIGDVKL